MKRKIFIAMAFSMLLCSCGKAENDVQSSSANNQSETTTTTAETTTTLTTTVTSELEYEVSIDDSVAFDSFDAFVNSEELANYLDEAGVSSDEIAQPTFDSTKYSLDSITMYSTCVYYYFINLETSDIVSSCMEFRQFDDYSQMKQDFDNMFSDSDGFTFTSGYGSDDEKEVYYIDGNHLSLYRLSQSGMPYGIFCEDYSAEQLYTCLNDISM